MRHFLLANSCTTTEEWQMLLGYKGGGASERGYLVDRAGYYVLLKGANEYLQTLVQTSKL